MTAQPWHQLCTLRDDVRSGEQALAEFAADLNAVRTGDARPGPHLPHLPHEGVGP